MEYASVLHATCEYASLKNTIQAFKASFSVTEEVCVKLSITQDNNKILFSGMKYVTSGVIVMRFPSHMFNKCIMLF